MLEAKAATAGEYERVILVRVRGAVAAAVDDGGVIEQTRLAFRHRRGVTHAIQESGELAGKKLVPFPQRLNAVLAIPTVTQAVQVFTLSLIHI